MAAGVMNESDEGCPCKMIDSYGANTLNEICNSQKRKKTPIDY